MNRRSFYKNLTGSALVIAGSTAKSEVKPVRYLLVSSKRIDDLRPIGTFLAHREIEMYDEFRVLNDPTISENLVLTARGYAQSANTICAGAPGSFVVCSGEELPGEKYRCWIIWSDDQTKEVFQATEQWVTARIKLKELYV